jgi:iron complex transport system permease protein
MRWLMKSPVLLITLMLSTALMLCVGATEILLLDLLMGHADVVSQKIFWEIRLPRVLLSIIVGAGVSVAGAVIQGLFRNPLADPALIGVSSGAALFAAGYMVLDLHTTAFGLLGVSGSAFVGGLLISWLVLEIGKRSGTVSSMLLAGIAFNSIAIAGVGLFSYLSSDLELRSVTFWALGSFNGADWTGVSIALIIPAAIVLLMRESRNLNAVTLGDKEAYYLGIDITRLRQRIVVLTAVIVGVGVALTGIVAFVGLVVPHLIRLTSSSNHSVVIPGSALLGAILVLLADGVGRSIISPAELPIGILTALLGGPFFVYLIMRQKGKLGI